MTIKKKESIKLTDLWTEEEKQILKSMSGDKEEEKEVPSDFWDDFDIEDYFKW